MLLTNSNCKGILISSPALTAVLQNPSTYQTITVNVTKNCCGTVFTETLHINDANSFQYGLHVADANVSGTASVAGVTFINLNTGILFNIPGITPSAPYTITNTGSIAGLLTLINNYFVANFPSFTPLTSPGSTFVSGNLNFYLAGLPANFAPISITLNNNGVYTIPGITTDYNFQTLLPGGSLGSYSTFGSSLQGQGLWLSPGVVANGYFPDSIYTIKYNITTNTGSIVSEQGCIFVDCLTRCSILTLLPKLSTDEQNEILMLHYGLTAGSNCNCNNCAELCDIYYELSKAINISNGITTNTNCGC